MEIARIKVFSNKAVVESRGVIVAGTVGATVGVEFDAQWLDMDSRTLVWRSGSVIKDDTACSGTVPQEVLEKSGQELFVGVYGTKGSTATPTLWACLGHIHAGADPSGDESTDPSLPVWAQADQKISLAQEAAQAAAASAAVKETFVAVYGQTAFGEVKEAYDAGRACFCDDGGTLAALALVTEAKLFFSAWVGHGIMQVYTLTAEDVWETDSDARYKTTELTSGSTHSQVPTAKTVYDALAQITDEVFVGKVSATTVDQFTTAVQRHKLVCVVDDTIVTNPMYIKFGSVSGGFRFCRVSESGIHWLNLSSDGTWSRGSQELDAAVEEALTAAMESGEFDGADGQDGEDGKSAYAFAQEGGYAGTEAEFAEKLAQEPELFLITIENKPGGGTADKTYAEILAAYKAGMLVVLKYGNYLHFLTSYSPSGMTFYPAVTSVGSPSANRKWTVTSADVWSYEDAGIPFATTAVTAESTDSQVPTAKAVWDAIEAKLAAFTNVAEEGA